MSNYPAAPASNAGSQGANGQSTVRDIFLLSDEQILEVLPEPASAGRPEDVEVAEGAPSSLPGSIEQAATLPASVADAASQPSATGNSAAAPAPFSNPEDVRALAELYPGGITQAKSSAERARLLDDIDRAYFGAHGSTPEQTRSARAQLAATMLREDPVAFREMVFEGLRALDQANTAPPPPAQAGFRAASSTDQQTMTHDAGPGLRTPELKPSATGALRESPVTSHRSLPMPNLKKPPTPTSRKASAAPSTAPCSKLYRM